MSITTEIKVSQDGAGLSLRVNHGYVGHTLEFETVQAIDAMGIDIRSRRLDVNVIGPAIWMNVPPAADVIANEIRAELTRMARVPYVGTLTGPDKVRLQGAVYGGMTRVRANAAHRAIKALVRMGATLRVTEFDTGTMHGPPIEPAPTSITAEIGTSGETETIELTGDMGADIAAAVKHEHYSDDSVCDITRALDDGYPFWSADLLQGATECPLLDAVITHYCATGAITDWQELARKDCDAWLASDTWQSHAYKCDSCEAWNFCDYGMPDRCGNCLGEHFTPHALDGFDVDGFVAGYLDAILFTESLDATGYGPDARREQLGADIESARRLGRDPQKQLCELADIDDDGPGDTSLLSHGCSRDDFTESAIAELRVDCVDFLIGNIADVREYCELRGDPINCSPDSFGRTEYSAAECAGTDFWFSRNGHGAGYFDRGNEPVYRRLQNAATVYGEAYIQFDGEEITT